MNRLLTRGIAAGAIAVLGGCITTSDFDPAEENTEEAARINAQLGAKYLQQGRYEQAKEKLERAISQDPGFAVARTYYGLLNEQLGETKEAEASYREALRLDPDDPTMLNIFGAFLCRTERVEQAERYFAEAAGTPLYGTPWVALTNAGICLLRVGDTERAEAYFRRALSLNRSYPDGLWQMARLSHVREVPLQARAFLDRYASVGAMTAEALWLGVQIERALGDSAAAEGYARQLKSDYPEALETRLLIESERAGGAT